MCNQHSNIVNTELRLSFLPYQRINLILPQKSSAEPNGEFRSNTRRASGRGGSLLQLRVLHFGSPGSSDTGISRAFSMPIPLCLTTRFQGFRFECLHSSSFLFAQPDPIIRRLLDMIISTIEQVSCFERILSNFSPLSNRLIHADTDQRSTKCWIICILVFRLWVFILSNEDHQLFSLLSNEYFSLLLISPCPLYLQFQLVSDGLFASEPLTSSILVTNNLFPFSCGCVAKAITFKHFEVQIVSEDTAAAIQAGLFFHFFSISLLKLTLMKICFIRQFGN